MDSPGSETTTSITSKRGYNLVVVLDDPPGDTNKLNTTCLKLYSHLLDDSETQLTYFSSGIGTYAHGPATSTATRLKRGIARYTDRLFAFTIKSRIKAAYQWLSQEYDDGDKIFVFGFSRGAYVGRALSAMIDVVGLIKPDNQEQIPYAYDLFRTYQGRMPESTMCDQFKTTFSRQAFKIYFVGAFDTVLPPTSVFGFKPLPLVGKHENVTHVRHAVAIDEIRARFSQPELYHQEGSGMPPDAHLKEVWFRGSHTNLGGPSSTGFSGLAALSWMEWESMCAGLKFQADVALGWKHAGDWAGMRFCDLAGARQLASWTREICSRPLAIHQPRKVPNGATLHVSTLYVPDRVGSSLTEEPWNSLLKKDIGDLPKRPPSGEPAYVDLDPFDPDDQALDYLCDESVFVLTDEALKIACVLSAFMNQSHQRSIQEIPQGVVEWALIRMLDRDRHYWASGNVARERKAESCVDAITRARPMALWEFLRNRPEVWKVDPLTTRELCLCVRSTFKMKMYEKRQTNPDGTTIFTPPEGLDGESLWNQIIGIWDRTDPGFPNDCWDSEDIFEALQRLAPFYPDLLNRDGPRIREAILQRRQIFERMASFNPERTYQALKWLFPAKGQSPDIRRVILDVVNSACRPYNKGASGYDMQRGGDFGPNSFNSALWSVVAKIRGHPDPFDEPDWKTEEQVVEAFAAKKLESS